MQASLRPLVAVLLASVLAGLTGCGALDELDPFADGVETEAIGVIDVPISLGGDFVPGTLRVTAGFPLPVAQVQAVLDARLPGAHAAAVAGEATRTDVRLPLGVTLEAAASALRAETAFAEISLVHLPDQGSIAAMLVETRPGVLSDHSPRLAWLAAKEQDTLVQSAFGVVVRVSGRLLPPARSLGPEATLRVEKVEPLADFALEAEGTFRRVGPQGTCVLLVPDSGEALELEGPKSITMALTSGLPGSRVRVTYRDLGLSTQACSGGRRGLVLDFTRR